MIVMGHADEYAKGNITLEEYRKAQGLKLASKYGYGGPKIRRKARRNYVALEQSLGIMEVRH